MIRRIRNYIGRRGFRLGGDWPSAGATPRPVVDPHVTFRPEPGEEWAYRGGHVYRNGQDLEEAVRTEMPDVGTWCHLLDALKAYDDWAYANGARQFRRLHFTINGLQERMLKQLRGIYHRRMGGLSLSFGDGALLINNVNVRALLAMYHVRPTEKAKRFLEGMKAKLGLILCHHHGNPQVSRVATLVQALYDELCAGLQRATIDARCLPLGRESLDCAAG